MEELDGEAKTKEAKMKGGKAFHVKLKVRDEMSS